MIRFLTAGESHGEVLIAILDGLPAGLSLPADIINHELARRQRGSGSGERMSIEKDAIQITSGVLAGQTSGAPIGLILANKDHANWKGLAIPPMTIPRPGHADLTGALKYAHRDLRLTLERASARETAMRVAAGAICKHLLAQFGILIGGYVTSIGSVQTGDIDLPYPERFEHAETSDIRCPIPASAARMQAEIEKARGAGDSLGGVIEIAALNLPVGLGSYTQWDRRLDARLAGAILSVPAIKGIEIGKAFENTKLTGTQVQDPYQINGSKLDRPSNHAGGLEGGITNGQPIVFRAAMKPVATTLSSQPSVDLTTGEEKPARYERSDSCPVPRAVPILEAMTALILADALMEKIGGDSLEEMRPRFMSLPKARLGDLHMDNQPHVFWE